MCGRKVRVNRAVRKPKPTSGPNQGHQNRPHQPNRKPFQPKKVFPGKKPPVGDDTKAKKSWGNKDGNKTGFKKQFKAKFNKKSDQAKNSFQGFTTSAEGKKFKKPRWTKDDSRKKSNAAKLAS